MSEQRNKIMRDLDTVVRSEQTGNRWVMETAEAAMKEIASLRAQLAEAQEANMANLAFGKEQSARLASARKALEPFAKIVQYINDKCHDSRPLVYGVESCHAAQLTVGDFRRAAASYTDEQGER